MGSGNKIPLEFKCGASGAMMANQRIKGLTQLLDNPETVAFYGGEHFICESITDSAAKLIAEALGGVLVEEFTKVDEAVSEPL